MAVDGQKTTRGWRIQYRGHLKGWTSSGLSGGTARNTGVKDFIGWYLGYGFLPAVFPGDAYTFKGSIDGSLGATGAAICTAIVVRGSVEQGGPIEFMVRFGGNGGLTLGSSEATDEATPNPGEGIDMKVAVNETDESDIRDVMMELTCAAKPYSSSGTAGVMKRVTGRIDAMVQYHTYEDAPSDYSAPGVTNDVIKVYCTESLYWEITNMHMDDVEDYGTDLGDENQLSDPPGGLCRWRMDGHTAGAAIGTIKTPAESPVTKWPAE